MKDFSKGLNGISADMLKSVAQISAESRQKAAEQAQQHKQSLAGRFESFRPVPADQIEKTPRAIERVYAGMAPAYKNEQKEETIAERVAALKVTNPKEPKVVTKHQPIPHDSVLLEPKITLKGGLKRKMEAESVELTDEDKAFLEQLNTEGKAHTIPKTDKEKSLAKLAEPKNKITHKDVMVGRGVVANEEAEQPVEEGWDDMVKSAKDALKDKPKPNGGAGMKQGTRYGGGKQKDTEEKKEKSEANEEVVDEMMMSSSSTKSSVKVKPGTKDNVGNGLAQQKFTNYIAQRRAENEKNKPQNEEVEQIEEKKLRDTPGQEHICAVHVKHSKLGEGKTLFSQHAEPAEDGSIAWYDVMFAEGIERVETKDLEIVVSESHMNHKKKK